MDDHRPDDTALFDETVIDRMIADLDAETVTLFVEVYLDEMVGRVEEIVNAMRTHDWVTVRAEAHSLKSTSGTFGAVALAARAQGIEEACDAAEVSEAARLADDLPQLARRTAEAVTSWAGRQTHSLDTPGLGSDPPSL